VHFGWGIAGLRVVVLVEQRPAQRTSHDKLVMYSMQRPLTTDDRLPDIFSGGFDDGHILIIHQQRNAKPGSSRRTLLSWYNM